MFCKNVIPVFAILSLLVSPQRAIAEPVEISETKTLEQHIEIIFGENAEVALAVLKHESGLRLDAKGWNCMYGGKSRACKPEDRPRAWSVDCGIAQVNVRGQVCPKNLLTLEGNMEQVERIYKEQGLNAWVSYKSGAYKKYMN